MITPTLNLLRKIRATLNENAPFARIEALKLLDEAMRACESSVWIEDSDHCSIGAIGAGESSEWVAASEARALTAELAVSRTTLSAVVADLQRERVFSERVQEERDDAFAALDMARQERDAASKAAANETVDRLTAERDAALARCSALEAERDADVGQTISTALHEKMVDLAAKTSAMRSAKVANVAIAERDAAINDLAELRADCARMVELATDAAAASKVAASETTRLRDGMARALDALDEALGKVVDSV